MHVTQRGNNKAAVFFEPQDRARYLHLLAEHSYEFECPVHAYALMTNHVHLLLTPERAESASLLMKNVGQRFAQYVNKAYRRTGSLWEGRFHSCIVDSETYLLRCHRYIELNPVRAGMVEHPGQYPWSSFNVNAYGEPSDLVIPHPVCDGLALTEGDRQRAYRALFINDLSAEDVAAIRKATRGGFALGSDQFVEWVGQELGVRSARKYKARTPPAS